MRIYTKKGDRGNTTLLRGGRVPKDELRVCAYGDVDELNSILQITLKTARERHGIDFSHDYRLDKNRNGYEGIVYFH